MTIEPASPAGQYTVMGTGPYAVNWPYADGAVRAAVVLAGIRTELIPGTDFTVSPTTAAVSGNLTLSGGAAATYAGGAIYLSRDTIAEQGWVGTLGEREKGLESQLDLVTMKVQEQDQGRDATLRFDTPVPPMVPVPGAVILFDSLGRPIAGPIAQDIADAQDNAAIATAAAVAADGSKSAAAASAASASASAVAAAGSAALAALLAATVGTDHSYLINADFRIWERNTPLALNNLYTGALYGGPDLWLNGIAGGGTVGLSRGTFAAGSQLGISDPRVYLQQQVAGHVAAGDYAFIGQRINPVDRYQNRQITITGWAMLPDGAGNIAVSAVQYFGTGGATSASVNVAPVTVALGVSWQKFKATLNIPSIAGKVRGTNDDEYLELRFWNSAGATQDALTNALGLQNRRLCLWGLQIHHGDVAADAADNFRIPAPAFTLNECQRFFQLGSSRFEGQATLNTPHAVPVWFATALRKVPTLTQGNVSNANFGAAPGNNFLTKAGFNDRRTATATGIGSFESTWQADAQL